MVGARRDARDVASSSSPFLERWMMVMKIRFEAVGSREIQGHAPARRDRWPSRSPSPTPGRSRRRKTAWAAPAAPPARPPAPARGRPAKTQHRPRPGRARAPRRRPRAETPSPPTTRATRTSGARADRQPRIPVPPRLTTRPRARVCLGRLRNAKKANPSRVCVQVELGPRSAFLLSSRLKRARVSSRSPSRERSRLGLLVSRADKVVGPSEAFFSFEEVQD